MPAPLGNSNRKGKTGIPYSLSVPRLKCGSCLAVDNCPVAGKPEDVCVFLRKLRKQRGQLDSLDGIKAVRRELILQTLVQLNIHIMSSEKTGVSDKNTITYRKILMEQLAQLERDEFDQQMKQKKTEDQQGFLVNLIKELGSKSALPDVEPIEVPWQSDELPMLEEAYAEGEN
jgi:hypothetical protein